jgi:homopolymeric O-antigen transport system permease protein
MGSYLRAVWQCRYFWMSLVKMDLRTRYRRSVLGLGWSLLNPIAMTAILCVVFPRIYKVDLKEYALYVLTSLACWNYVRTVTSTGCLCLFRGEPYIRQYPAPMAIYPLRTALGETIHFMLALLVVVGLSWIIKGFDNVPSLLSLVPTLVLLFVFGWALAVLAGFATVHFHDTQHLCDIGFQILFYATPIMWKPEMLGEGRLARLLSYNPLIAFLDLVRRPIEQGEVPSLANFAVAATVTLGLVGAAGLVLMRLQRRLIFHL